MQVLGTVLILLISGCAGVVETPPSVASSPEMQLNLAELESRLRDTTAIGAITKLVLGNEASDLMNRFRAQHLDGRTAGVASLRQPYNMFILKLLALTQDRDPNLARSLSDLREVIWGALTDPKTFHALIGH